MAMLLEYVRGKSPIKTIPNIIVEQTYKAINELREALYMNAADNPMMLRGGRNGHIGLLMDAAVYVNVAYTAYKRPAEPGP